MQRLKKAVRRFIHDRRGEGFVDIAIKILIVVVIGFGVLVVMNTAMPGLFTSLTTKLTTAISSVTVPPH